MWLTRFAIKNPTVITLFFLAVAVFGLIGYKTMGQNINPNVQFPDVSVEADYAGASPEEMERLIVRPIEDQLQNVAHVNHIYSTIEDGIGFIDVQFKLGTDVNFAATDVQQAVDTARVNLPSDLDPPSVSKNDTTGSPILLEGIAAPGVSPSDLSNIVNNELIPDLRAVKGVGGASASGTYTRQITVEPNLARLQSVGGTLNDLTNAVSQGNVSLPGGRMDQSFQESTMGVRADIRNAWEIARLPLSIPGGATNQLKIGDVANVIDGYADQRMISTYNSGPG